MPELDTNILDTNAIDTNVAVDPFVDAIQTSGVKDAIFDLIMAYIDLIYNMFATGGFSGLLSFGIVMGVLTFVLMQIVPVKMPKFAALAIATLITIVLAPFIVLPLYLVIKGFVGV